MPSKSRYPFLQLTLHDFMTVCFLLVLGIPISITSISAVLYLTSAFQARHPLPPSKRHRHSCYLHIAILTLFTQFVPACYAEPRHRCTTAFLVHSGIPCEWANWACLLSSRSLHPSLLLAQSNSFHYLPTRTKNTTIALLLKTQH